MKFAEWLGENGSRIFVDVHAIAQELSTVVDPEAELLAGVVDEVQKPGVGYSWINKFMFLTADRLVNGHVAYQSPVEESQPEGIEFRATVIPLQSVAEVSANSFTSKRSKKTHYVVKLKNEQQIYLPPGVCDDRVALNEYLHLGKCLANTFTV